MLRELFATIGLCFFLALSVLAFFYPIHIAYFYFFIVCITAISCYIAYSREKKLPGGDQTSISRSLRDKYKGRKIEPPINEKRTREKREAIKGVGKKEKKREEEDILFQQAKKILNE